MIIRNMAALFALRNGTHLGRFAVVAVFLLSFLVSGAWGACTEGRYPNAPTDFGSFSSQSAAQNQCTAANYPCPATTGLYLNPTENQISVRRNPYPTYYYCNQQCIYSIYCSTQDEVDSLYCELHPYDESCAPQIDSSACDSYRQECESFGGRFTGNVVSPDVSETGCLSFCDMCTSEGQELYRKSRAMVCCRKGMAPPASVTSCQNLELSGSPDMSFSSFDCDNRGGYDCECEDINSDNASTYNSICNNNEWPDDDMSSAGGSAESSSSEEGSPSDTSGDWEYDYRDSLHRIIKYDSINMENTSAILSCLLSPVSCDGLNSGGDSVVVNVPSDSAILKDIRQNQQTMNTLVDTSIHNSFDYLGNVLDTAIHGSTNRLGATIDVSLGRANDSLIDSIGKYVRGMSERTSDSLHDVAEAVRNLGGDIQSFDSATRAGIQDIINSMSGLGLGGWDSVIAGGTVKGDSGYGGYGNDSSSYGGILGDAFGEGDGYADSAYSIEGDTCTSVDCIVGNANVDSMGQAFRLSLDTTYQQIEDSSETWFTSIRDNLKFVDFDSVLLEPLKNVVPNTNTCPEECFKGSISTLSGFKSAISFDFGLCRTWNIGGININALLFVRLLLRILTAVCCIYIGLWFIAGRK